MSDDIEREETSDSIAEDWERDEMRAFMDAACNKCGKRFGWVGELKDRPPCPSCGHKPPLQELEKDQIYLNEMKELLGNRKTPPEIPS